MSKELHQSDRLSELVAGLLDGILSDTELEELRTRLRNDDSVREQYFEQIVTHAMLEWRQGTPNSPATHETKGGALSPQTNPVIAAQLLQFNAPQIDQVLSGEPSKPGFTGGLGSVFSSFAIVFLLILVVSVGVVQFAHWFAPGRGWFGNPRLTAGIPRESAQPLSRLKVVKLTTTADCGWIEAAKGLQVGNAIPAGRSYELIAGDAELTLDSGVRLLFQSPASFSVDSLDNVRLNAGKLTAEINNKNAAGLKIITPDGTFIDRGTEFGVEVDPGSNTKMCVFKGEVDLMPNDRDGALQQSYRVFAGSSVRLERKTGRVTEVKDSGDAFVRTIDAAERDRHVVAYWRFEDQLTKQLLPGASADTTPFQATVDSSYNGNDLYADRSIAQLKLSDDVAAPQVLQTAAHNSACLDNTEVAGLGTVRGLFTRSLASHAAPIDIQEMSPTRWTIEASVKVHHLDGIQTFVGRSGAPPNIDLPVRLAFQITGDGCFAISFRDGDNRPHGVVANDYSVAIGHWYHVAAVCDGRQLTLYANALDGAGYRQLATTTLPSHGSTALATGGMDAAWTVGFGKDVRSARSGKWFNGCLDEIRICDKALSPAELLFAGND
jgi:Concanavalin A-like lectin/glucanases superfamily/FecR protein